MAYSPTNYDFLGKGTAAFKDELQIPSLFTAAAVPPSSAIVCP